MNESANTTPESINALIEDSQPGASDFATFPAVSSEELLRDLNEQQLQAVTHGNGPLLVLAGAGTGKTRVLTHRLAYRIVKERVQPSQIMAVTFTNKAAREMRHRLEHLLGGQGFKGMLLGTFHSISARILRRHAELVERTSGFTIIDADDQLRLIRKIMTEQGFSSGHTPPRVLAHRIESWKNKLLSPEAISARDVHDEAGNVARDVYHQYQKRLRRLNALDFGDLLMLCITLFQANANVLTYWQDRLHHILVDEYQDTNHAQEVLLRLLAAGHMNICCVGDEDQSIYSWRGADIRHILEFQNQYPGAAIIKLERNYRSTSQILHVAATLISNNTERLGKTLQRPDHPGNLVRVFVAYDGNDEASSILHNIHQWRDSGKNLTEAAILVRVSAQTRLFEEACLKSGLPYIIYGGMRFYEREEIRDCIAYLRLVYQPRDDLAFDRIINKPPRGIGNVARSAIALLAREQDLPAIESMRVITRSDELRMAARNSCAAFLRLYDTWREHSQSDDPVSLLKRILDESGYSSRLNKSDDIAAESRLENIKELLSAMQDFSDLASFLEHVSLVMDNERLSSEPCLNIMTIHSAKGLEFDRVYLPGWEDGLIPHERALQEGGQHAVEEERRLAYVAITRARSDLIISCARRRLLQGSWRQCYPSRFLDELPRNSIDFSVIETQVGEFYPPESSPAAIPTPTNLDWQPDMPCWHPKFGLGRVTRITSDDLVTVDFPLHGQKTTIASYLQAVDDDASGAT